MVFRNFSILGDPGGASRDGAIFSGESLFEGQKTSSPWVSEDEHDLSGWLLNSYSPVHCRRATQSKLEN